MNKVFGCVSRTLVRNRSSLYYRPYSSNTASASGHPEPNTAPSDDTLKSCKYSMASRVLYRTLIVIGFTYFSSEGRTEKKGVCAGTHG